MNFSITLYPIHPLNLHDPDDSSLSEAIQTCFHGSSDYIILQWGNSKIKLSWECDVSEILYDVISMIKKLSLEKIFFIQWGSSSFFARWNFEIVGELLIIKPQWGSVNLIESIDKNELNCELLIHVNAFINEWMKILICALDSLKISGYTESQINEIAQVHSCAQMLRAKQGL